jgi:O-antigen chain-terminating methyltransferase
MFSCGGDKMSKTKISVEEVMERIREAMRSKKMEAHDFTNISIVNNRNVDVVNEKLSQLDIEIRNNNIKWNIITEFIIASRRKFFRSFIVFCKKLLRKSLRWYINPPFDQQRDFNGSITRSINILGDLAHTFNNNTEQIKLRLDVMESQLEANNNQLTGLKSAAECQIEANNNQLAGLRNAIECQTEASNNQFTEIRSDLETQIEASKNQINELKEALENKQVFIQQSHDQIKNQLKKQVEAELTVVADRLRRIERKVNEGVGLEIETSIIDKMVIDDKLQNPDLDYFLFEQRFRGSREEIKERQRIYLDYYKGKSNVLDLGCGRGEFMELLLENGISATGIDLNEEMIKYCRGRNLPVIQCDLFDYMISLSDNSLDGIFAAQVIEHLEPDSLVRFIQLSYKKLKADGVFLVETINLQTLLTFANQFYMDLSHKKPVHPATLQFIMECEGFNKIDFIYTNPCTSRMIPNLFVDVSKNNLHEFNQAVDKLNQLLYGPQDYAIIGIK